MSGTVPSNQATCPCFLFTRGEPHLVPQDSSRVCPRLLNTNHNAINWQQQLCLSLTGEPSPEQVLRLKENAYWIRNSRINRTDIYFRNARNARAFCREFQRHQPSVRNCRDNDRPSGISETPALRQELQRAGSRETQQNERYSHKVWKSHIRHVKFDKAYAYLEKYKSQKREGLEDVIYQVDASYHLRRGRLFAPAIKHLEDQVKKINDLLYPTPIGSQERRVLNLWKYFCLVNQAKCYLKSNAFDNVQNLLTNIDDLLLHLPDEIVKPYAFRVEEVKIELWARKASEIPGKDGAEARRILLEEAEKHATNLIETLEKQKENGKPHYLLARSYEILADILLKLEAVVKSTHSLINLTEEERSALLKIYDTQINAALKKALEIYQPEFGKDHLYTKRAQTKLNSRSA